MDSQENSAARRDSKRTLIDMLTAHVRLWLLSVSFLMLFGIYISMGPKLPRGPIHIHLARGHAITTQDVVALLPIGIAVIWFGLGMWKHRAIWLGYIRRSPIKAFFFALVLGLLLGLLFGIPGGAIYRTEVRHFIQFLTSFIR